MSAATNPTSVSRSFSNPIQAAGTMLALAGMMLAPSLQAQASFDFDNGNDSGWLRSSEHPSTITFPADATGGKAYRLQGTPLTTSTGSDTNARVFSIFTNRLYTNFFAAVDVVSWNTNQDANMVIGIIGRVNGNFALPPTSFLYGQYPLDPDRPSGMSFNARLHNYRDYGPGNTPLGSRDQTSIWGLVNAFGAFQLGNPVTVSQTIGFRWVPGRAYRLVLTCTNSYAASPTFFSASIYDCNDLTRPLLSWTGDDSYNGNNLYIPLYGYAGVMAFHLSDDDPDPSVDATFDNFYIAETAPTSVPAPGIPHGLVGAPQVVSRVPASFANFHPAASGISFRATTLTATNTVSGSAIKLYLNGVDVSAGLSIAGPATNYTVTYSGLVSNVVYDARIELQDALGRQTTNEWTFDTFSDAYLASSAVKVIEAEDYNFTSNSVSGEFIDDPPVSGYENYSSASDTGNIYNYQVGYVDQVGTRGEDFFDYDGSPQSSFSAYRHMDGVGTQQGNYATYVYSDTANVALFYQSYETQRIKYSSVDPTLQEYVVTRTEGGEWLNYTRIFNGTRYNAYLRVACGLAQPVRLDQIGAGPATNYLGTFNVPSTLWLSNYRYVPLRAADGSLAVLGLNGTATLRLTMDSPQNNATKQGLSMNYMVLVPAAPQVFSSSAVSGTYTPETSVLVSPGLKSITVPQSGGARFYRIGWSQAATIKGISLANGNVVLTYQ